MIRYPLDAIRPGAVVRHDGHALGVVHVQLTTRGVALHTLHANALPGPVLTPYAGAVMDVLYMPEITREDAEYLRRATLDYPWAMR